ncbi:hypothetical protein GC209_13965 [bacterium]|nr:hypothetical protein [bacterium]
MSEHEDDPAELAERERIEKETLWPLDDRRAQTLLIVDQLPPNPRKRWAGLEPESVAALLDAAIDAFYEADDWWRWRNGMTGKRKPSKYRDQFALGEMWKVINFGRGEGSEIKQNYHTVYYRPIGLSQIVPVAQLVIGFWEAREFYDASWQFRPLQDGLKPRDLQENRRLLLLICQYLYPGYEVKHLRNALDWMRHNDRMTI